MMYFKRIIFLLLLSLGSCGPIYGTEYEIIPPQTEYGAMCANNCVLMRSNCERSCHDRNDQCYRIKELELQNRYLYEVNQRNMSGLPIPKRRDTLYFYGSEECSNNGCISRCEMDYHICHRNCGGDVIAHSRCTAFCN